VDFRIAGLSAAPFKHLYGLSDDALAELGVKAVIVDESPGFPDRIEMRDGIPGERFLLLNHQYQPADSPYRASHAIYVRDGAEETYDRVNEVPASMRLRLLSLRAFDADHMIIDADVVDGSEVEPVIERLLANPKTAYIQVHNARQGCYAGRIERA